MSKFLRIGVWRRPGRGRWGVVAGAVVCAGGIVGLMGHAAGPAQGALTRSRDMLVTYHARINQLPRQAGAIDVWIPLAPTTDEQQVLQRRIHAPAPYTVARDPEYGNEILHFRLQPPLPDGVEVSIDYQVRLGFAGRGGEMTGPSFLPADAPARYLDARGLVIIDDEVRARAVRAVAGAITPLDKARGIYEAVLQQVAYDKIVPGWGRGDTLRVCRVGAGNCTDFHSLFISMARASRIPARFKIGLVIPQDMAGAIPGYHCWAEFYVEGRGWVPVDASEAWKHPELKEYYFGARDPNRLLISLGRDVQLVPRQQGAPVNMLFYPYVEVNGQAFDEVDTRFTFRELNQEEAV